MVPQDRVAGGKRMGAGVEDDSFNDPCGPPSMPRTLENVPQDGATGGEGERQEPATTLRPQRAAHLA